MTGPRQRTMTAFIALALSALPWTAMAEAFDAQYRLNYGGIHIADIRLAVLPGEDGVVRSSLAVETRGLIDRFARYEARYAAIAKDTQPVLYQAEQENGRAELTTSLRYDPVTGVLIDIDNRKRGKPRGVDVEPEERVGALDPLNAFALMRAVAEAGVLQESLTVPVFDGRKRYDVTLQPLGRETIEQNGARVAAQRLRVDFTPVAGYEDEEYQPDEEDAGRWIEAWVATDGSGMPLRLRTRNTTIIGTIEREQDCNGNAARLCELPLPLGLLSLSSAG